VNIRDATPRDADAICRIYNYYIAETVITFEEEQIDATEIATRIDKVQSVGMPWIVLEEEDGAVLGYAYAGEWRGRCAFRYTVETTVYLDHQAGGRGYGTRLYEALIERLRATKIHTLVAGIALPNEASVALHEKLGFTKVGHFTQVGWKLNRWIDVGYWELVLDNKNHP
jgi:phosphinothricin acetyltransferase